MTLAAALNKFVLPTSCPSTSATTQFTSALPFIYKMSAFPPHRSVASIPVPQEIALKYLSTYLEAAKSSPHLLPNARLEPSGPTAGSSSSSITIHNLQRVEAGLRGEWLAPTLELEEDNVPIAEGMDDGTNKGQSNEEGEGWMDLDDYQREQSIAGGDVESGLMGAVQEGGVDSDLEMDNHADEHDEDLPTKERSRAEESSPRRSKKTASAITYVAKEPLDKAARKEQKRLKNKEEKRQKEEARRKKAAK